MANTLKLSLDHSVSVAEQSRQLGTCIAGLGTAFIILDNFEQIAEWGDGTVGIWSQCAIEARFMVTSRQRLVLDEEHAYELKPLQKRTQLHRFWTEHRRLIRILLRRVLTTRAPSNRDTLDCIPLALQLAAGRARLLSAKQIQTRLDTRFRLLRKGPVYSSAKQPCAQPLIGLESAHRGRAFGLAAGRGVPGGFTLSAEAIVDLSVLGDEAPWLEEVMQGLADKSMLFVREMEDSAVEQRICTFDSIRYYALENSSCRGCLGGRTTTRTLLYGVDSRAKYLSSLGEFGDGLGACETGGRQSSGGL